MRLLKNQTGVAGIEIVLFVVVLAIAGVVAFRAFSAKPTANAPVAEPSPIAKDVPAAPSINSASDLTAAENTLNQVDPDDNSSDSSQLDTQLSSF